MFGGKYLIFATYMYIFDIARLRVFIFFPRGGEDEDEEGMLGSEMKRGWLAGGIVLDFLFCLGLDGAAEGDADADACGWMDGGGWMQDEGRGTTGDVESGKCRGGWERSIDLLLAEVIWHTGVLQSIFLLIDRECVET